MCPAAAGWAIWDRGRHRRSGRLLVCDAWQRLHCVGSARGPEPSASACRPAVQPRPESDLLRQLYDCPDVPVGPEGVRCRVVVATHPAGETKSRIGHTRQGVVYELFFTHLPQDAFTASDVVALYLHRGAFEPVLADEDQEQDPDRWCSHAPAGQEAWQIVSQWVWNLRLELGHVLEPTPMRTTEFAPACHRDHELRSAPVLGYGQVLVASPWKAGRFSGKDFPLQPDGTLRCPARQDLAPHERRREADGSLRVVYAASIRDCRPCPLREQCQWHGQAHRETTPGQCAAASAPRWFRTAALARLEPQSAPARLYAARTTPTHRGEPVAPSRSFATHSRRDSFPRAASALSPLVARAARSQCACSNGWPGDDQAVRHPRRLCRLARFGDGLTWHGLAVGAPSSRTRLLLRVEPYGLFPWLFLDFSSSSALFALHPSGSATLSRTGLPLLYDLSLIRSGMNSSTISLRNSWARRTSTIRFYPYGRSGRHDCRRAICPPGLSFCAHLLECGSRQHLLQRDL